MLQFRIAASRPSVPLVRSILVLMFRNGWENNVKSIDALPYVEAGSNARTSDISSGEYAVMPLAPMKGVRCAERRTASGLGVLPHPSRAVSNSTGLRYFAQP